MAISNFVSSTLSFDGVVSAVLSDEMGQMSTSESSSGADLTIKGKQKVRGMSSRNHGKQQECKSMGKMECWHCGKKRHLNKRLLISKWRWRRRIRGTCSWCCVTRCLDIF